MMYRRFSSSPRILSFSFCLDDVLLLPFFDSDEGPENVQYGQIGHGPAIVKASTFKIPVIVLREKISELQQQPGFADSGFTHDAHDLAFSGLHLVEGLFERFDLTGAAHKSG